MTTVRLGFASVLLALGVAVARAQQPDTVNINVSAGRSMVTRATLQASLADLERELSSTAYSPALRAGKEAEAEAIRQRLAPDGGDFHNGDQLMITILEEPGLSATYTITPNRTILLPGGNEISLSGVLRSEVEGYLTTQLKRFINDPSVTATPYIRVSIFGGVSRPGFYYIPANTLLSDAIMAPAFSNGPANNVKWDKSEIRRDKTVVVDGTEFSGAIYKGRTLDQLNVQAGDDIQVAQKPASALFFRILATISGLTGLVYLAVLIF